MSDFLKTYFGVLGGMTTFVAIVRYFGKSVIEDWLKRDYKKWESELEEKLKRDFKHYEEELTTSFKKLYKEWEVILETKYKEDFKRFESELDSSTARDGAKFAYFFPKQADSASEFLGKCRDLNRKLNEFVEGALVARGLVNKKEAGPFTKIRDDALQAQIDVSNAYLASCANFTKELNESTESALSITREVIDTILTQGVNYKEVDEYSNLLHEYYERIEKAYKKLVGNTE